MAVFYLDVDDEITTAATRIRSTEDVDVALVLPAGSRIATSRINFRLLAREAQERSRRLAIVAPEASARALAASAGLPVFASVLEYDEARTARGSGPDEAGLAVAGLADAGAASASADTRPASSPGAGAAVVGASGVAAARAGTPSQPVAATPPSTPGPPADSTAAPGGTAAGGAAGSPSLPAATPTETTRPRGALGPSTGLGPAPVAPPARRGRWPFAVAGLLVLALVAGAALVVGYVLLPAATVTLSLVAEPVGPVAFVGTADPDALAVDPQTATIPAVRIPIPLSATGTFPATGKRVVASAATGQVRWTNCDPTRSYTFTQGTRAQTPGGIAFATQETVFVPVATISSSLKLTCQSRTVNVQAVLDGPSGNVPAGTITVIPGQYNSVVIKVVNLAPTTGGARQEFPQVSQKDVAAAVAQLTKQLDEQLAAGAANPQGVPAGSTAYPETARHDPPVPSVAATDLVGQEVTTFDLTLTADGTVVAADPSAFEAIGAARVATQVPAGMRLVEGSTSVTIGEGIATGELVHFPVQARGQAVRDISEQDVRALVKGKTPAEATSALAGYGSLEVSLWPGWVSTITGVDARLSVSVVGVPPVAPGTSPAPQASPPPSATPPAASPPPAATPPASAAP